jgi:hypothetical protein
MRTPLAIRETEVMEKALAALPRTTGLHGKIAHTKPRPADCGDALIEITTAHRVYPFVVEVKNVRHFATLALSQGTACLRRTGRPASSYSPLRHSGPR